MKEQAFNVLLWGDKRYQSLNYYLRKKFKEKVFKIPLDAGFTCPNRDGTLAYGGCSFCSPRGSGDFTAGSEFHLKEQFLLGKEMMQNKWKTSKYIIYFQAYTNTYASAEKLKQTYECLLAEPGVVGIAISTRPDCVNPEVLRLLQELNQTHYLWVELGLQTIHGKTAETMNMCYDLSDFKKTLAALQSYDIETCAHIILGLPGETRTEMLATGYVIAQLPLQGLKIHLFHLMQDTALAERYQSKQFEFLSQREYVDLVVDVLEILPPGLVIHRLTGDSPRERLIAPKWSLNKWETLNLIDQRLIQRNTWQGKKYKCSGNKAGDL